MNTTDSAPKVKRRAPKIKGMLRAAAALGCTPNHLHEVLRGRRPSRRLLERYRALVNVAQPAAPSVPPSPNP